MRMTLEEMKKLPKDQQKALFDKLHAVRHQGKTTNYSSQYGVGKAKLARELKIPEVEAKKLLDAYWKVNWAIKACAEKQYVKRIKGQDWIYNPISKFFYPLRNEKDRWSTLVQGSGVFCFDEWIRIFREKRGQLTGQFHDEVVLEIKKNNRDKATNLLRGAIDQLNDNLKLNVKLDADIQFGDSYAEIH